MLCWLIRKSSAKHRRACWFPAWATRWQPILKLRACQRSNATNCVGGKTTLAAMALARLCYDTLMADGRKAAPSPQAGAAPKRLKPCGSKHLSLRHWFRERRPCPGAHAHPQWPDRHPRNPCLLSRGEGRLRHARPACAGDEHFEQIQEVVRFCTDVGLPTTLADLGIAEIKPEQIHAVAELACAPSDTLGNMPLCCHTGRCL